MDDERLLKEGRDGDQIAKKEIVVFGRLLARESFFFCDSVYPGKDSWSYGKIEKISSLRLCLAV